MAETRQRKPRAAKKAEPAIDPAAEAIAKGQQRTFKRVPKTSGGEQDATVNAERHGAPVQDAQPEPASPARSTKLIAGIAADALKDVLGAVARRGDLPILTHVLLQSAGSSLQLTATDLDMWVSRDLAAEPDADALGFSTCVPAAPLAKLLGEFEDDLPVSLELIEAAKGTPRLALKAGRSRFLLNCLAAEDFPAAPPFTAIAALDLPCTALDDALAAVDHTISTEETRYYLNGVFVHVAEGALRFAATDGNRLARWSADCPDGGDDFPAQIVSRHTVKLLEKLLPAAARGAAKDDPAFVLVECAGTQAGALMRFSMPASGGGEVLLTAKSIDGTFPDYTRVIPADAPLSATLGKGALAQALRRVAVLSAEKSRAVRVQFSAGKLTLAVASPELGEASAALPAMYDGDDFAAGFNADLLLQALAKIAADEVVLRFSQDPTAPVLILPARSGDDDPRLLQVLMPMRV